MKQLETEVLIEAGREKVWSVLMDFDRHAEWNPFIRSISGEAIAGKTIHIFLQPPGEKGMAFKPLVLKAEQNREFRWKGKLGIGGIFDGEHYFLLQEADTGHTRLVHGERFSGILIPFMGKMLEKTKAGFEAMNQALKTECEK